MVLNIYPKSFNWNDTQSGSYTIANFAGHFCHLATIDDGAAIKVAVQVHDKAIVVKVLCKTIVQLSFKCKDFK